MLFATLVAGIGGFGGDRGRGATEDEGEEEE